MTCNNDILIFLHVPELLLYLKFSIKFWKIWSNIASNGGHVV